ncbi:hypothetical protein AVEN_230650-1 [Araneus ventricosus]|uniref:Uncharacterized protein n=1 Tax=Araneus ventricosus TaxID=182803 RepID=A0A4Y2A306_ARAVE|nr:hypothetical protein AVEN_230650-1 [Araneus ventricosus]
MAREYDPMLLRQSASRRIWEGWLNSVPILAREEILIGIESHPRVDLSLPFPLEPLSCSHSLPYYSGEWWREERRLQIQLRAMLLGWI